MTKIFGATNPLTTNNSAIAAEVTTLAQTTTSLAQYASADLNFTTSKTGILASFTADRSCLIRVYSTSANRSADSRAYNASVPAAGVTGLIAEVEIDTTIANNIVSNVIFANADSPQVGTLYFKVFNLGTVGTIQLDVGVAEFAKTVPNKYSSLLWDTTSASLTAETGKGYYCSLDVNIATPISPSLGDVFGVCPLSNAQVSITSTKKINSLSAPVTQKINNQTVLYQYVSDSYGWITDPYFGITTLSSGIVAFWKFETNSWLDSGPSSYTLTSYNTPIVGAGKIGNAVQLLNSSTQRLYASSDFKFSNYLEWTISYWTKCTDKNTYGFALSKSNSSAINQFEFHNYRGTPGQDLVGWYVAWGNTGSDYAVISMNFPFNVWSHIIFQYSYIEGKIKLWVDGVFIGQANVSTTVRIVTSTTPFQIGGYGNAGGASNVCYTGLVDEVVVWNRLLTDVEKTALYNSGNGLII